VADWQLLTKKQLHRAPGDVQTCALKAVSVLASRPLLRGLSPQEVDDIVIRTLPLLFLGRNGNKFGGRVLEVLGGSALGKACPVIQSFSPVSKEEGKEGHL